MKAQDTSMVLVQFVFISVLMGLSLGMGQIATTLYAVDLESGTSEIGFIGGVQGIGMLLTVLPVGMLVDRVGPRRVFLFGALSSALLYMLFPVVVRTSYSLCVYVSIIGFFMAFRFVPMTSVFLDLLKNTGNDKAGWQRGAHSFGFVFLGPLFGAVVSRHFGLPFAFVVISCICISLLIAALVFFPDRYHSGTERPKPESFSERIADIRSLFRDVEVLDASLAEALTMGTFSCFSAFIVVTAIRVFHFTTETASMLVTLEGIVYIGALFFLWRLLGSLGQRRFYLASILVVLLALTALSILSHPAYMIAGAALIGLGLGMFNLVNVTRLSQASAGKGKTAGIFALFTMGGSIIGPVLGGIAGEWVGLWAVFPVFVPFYLLLGIRLYRNLNTHKACLGEAGAVNQIISEEF
ncbi:MAG: MFS transporter [Chlorobiaceae bacterium]|nr:MFS transporter [Chlorobiaceae bacterium]